MTTRAPAMTFLGTPYLADPASCTTDFAFLGVPFCVPYVSEVPLAVPSSTGAPDWVRAASAAAIGEEDHYDFDLGGPLSEDGELSLVDCGDVIVDPRDVPKAAAATTEVVRAIVRTGAIPLVLGGDHSIPPQVVRGLEGDGELDVLHIDAHLDYRDEVDGVEDGYSSPIRRLRELPFVRDIVQVGLRGTGTARRAEVEAAEAAGNVLITADEVHEQSADIVIDRLRSGARYYLTIDVDGMDPSYAPATGWPLPGGLTYPQVARIVRHVARHCDVAGVDVCELIPARDVNGLTGLVVVRLLMNLIGLVSRRRCSSAGS